jgi:cytolysin (calcineurin-like family phosphatase)
VSFKRGYNSGISSWDIDINTSISADGVLADWLKNDLDRAVEEGRNIILNWHRFNDVYNDKIARQNLMVALSPYVNSIKAIFVGHAHGSFGHIDDLVFSNGINIIPVIYSGSAIYSRFVRVDFNSSRVCTINTQVRNTFNQTNTNNSNGNNGQYQINCGAKDSIFQSISKFFRQIFSLKK